MTATLTHSFRRGGPAPEQVLSYADDIRLLRGPRRSPWRWIFLAAAAALYWFLPTHYVGDPGLRTLAMCGIFAIGAIGLNLLIGYTGQVSLGHAFFVGAGAYTAAYVGGERGWPMPAYLALAVLIGFVVGGVIGPFALRLRGNYLVIVTLGLVFLGEHLWTNWESVTGGGNGVSLREAPMALGPLDFATGIEIGGEAYTFEQSFFWLVWALVAVAALLAGRCRPCATATCRPRSSASAWPATRWVPSHGRVRTRRWPAPSTGCCSSTSARSSSACCCRSPTWR
jgi:branched-chain amino acid transport system permease protein